MHILAWRSERINFENRGQIRIIEAFLAMLIIFSSFSISANLTSSQKIVNQSSLDSVGLHALLKLDSDGSLGKYVDNSDWADLRNALSLVLPTGISFNMTVYNEQMEQLNAEVVSNGSFNSREITCIEYICASQGQTFHCYIIHLYLAVTT